MIRIFVVSLTALLLNACSSVPQDMMRGTEPEGSVGNAHPAGYEVDTFRMQKWQKRRPATSSDFFFKKCAVMDGKTYWSKTSYDCSRL
jgi:hypothetical protein